MIEERKITLYRVRCDRCDRRMPEGGWMALDGEDTLEERLRKEGWRHDDMGKLCCPKCYIERRK